MSDADAFIIRRIPLAQLHRNRLILGLACPSCGHKYRTDYYISDFKAGEGVCPSCGARLRLRQKDLRIVLERSFRRVIKRIESVNDHALADALSATIFNSIELLKPILKVVIVRLRSERIGHYILNTFNFLWRLEDEGYSEALLFAEPPDQELEANHYLGKKWRERFISTSAVNRAFPPLPFNREKKPKGLARMVKKLRKILRKISAKKDALNTAMPSKQFTLVQSDNVVSLYASSKLWESAFDLDPAAHTFPITFTPEEEEQAQNRLADMGIRPGSPYVCFLGRDPVYMEKAMPFGKWTYQDYRNMDINTYLPAMRWLTEQGVTCLRMGSAVEKPLSVSQPGIVDYAVSYRDEFMDIYLFSNCRFAVSCGTGPDLLPGYKKRHVLLCNFPVLHLTLPIFRMSNLSFINKKFWSHEENRLLSFQEIFSRNLDCFGSSDEFRNHGIDLIDNTPEEILAGVQETYAKAMGAWTMSDEEKQMQEKYRQLLTNAHPDSAALTKASPSGAYMKMNPYLLA